MKRILIAFVVGVVGLMGLSLFHAEQDDQNLVDIDPHVEEEVSRPIADTVSGGEVSEEVNGLRTYLHEGYGFSFDFPGEASISSIPDLGGEILLVRGDSEEFQIYVASFDEEGPITTARIKQDLPNLEINDDQQVVIGEGKNIEALIFHGVSEDFGETREVWFVGNGHLFQVITPKGGDTFIGPIVDSWKFI
jgi:hypothetical protein